MDLAAQGMSDRQIGLELGISRDTVASYWRRILLKFGSSKRTEVVARFAEQQAAKAVADVQQSNVPLREEITKRKSDEEVDASKRLLLNAAADASTSFIGGQSDLYEIFVVLLSDLLKAISASHSALSLASTATKATMPSAFSELSTLGGSRQPHPRL